MLKLIATDVVISKGYNGAPALRFSDKGDSVRFRIGKKVYDSRAENNTRWVNLSVKAFGPICERISKMQLKEGSFVHLSGRLDEEVWQDQETQEEKSMTVVVLEEIEYASGGGNKANDSQGKTNGNGTTHQTQTGGNHSCSSQNFDGYEPFSGNSFFDD